jgi:hypothetical protein
VIDLAQPPVRGGEIIAERGTRQLQQRAGFLDMTARHGHVHVGTVEALDGAGQVSIQQPLDFGPDASTALQLERH